MDSYVFTLLMMMLGFPMVTLIGHYGLKIMKAKNNGKNDRVLTDQVATLLKENQELQERLYNMETIVLDEKDQYILSARNKKELLATEIRELAESKKKLS